MPKWRLEGRLYEGRIRVVTDDESKDLVALANIGMSGSTENARLIAAAPRMLEALRRLIAQCDTRLGHGTLNEEADKARAILKDIEG